MRTTNLRRAGLILLSGLLLAGCAPRFSRSAAPASQYELDVAACRREQAMVPAGPAAGGLAGVLFMAGYVSRRNQVLADCMTGRGYVKE